MNLRGAFAVAQEVARGMVKAGIPGVILNISSIASIHSMFRHSVYSSTKVFQLAYPKPDCNFQAGLDMLSKVMALELGPKGVGKS